VDQSFAHPHCRLRFFFILFFLSLSPIIIVAHYTLLPKPYLNAIVQHGGPGITHAAILHALPQVIVAPGPGQGTQAHLVSRAGLGRFLHLEEIRLENLRNLIASVLTDPQIQANAHAYQAQFAALPGISGAAAALEALAD
jgi:UDP:flavonoid glycosyltransferase YjiC (YdhE family)